MTTAHPTQLAPKEFTEFVRAKQFKRGKSLKGSPHLSDSQLVSINLTLEDMSLAKQFNNTNDSRAIRRLLVRFEDMCRRNSETFPEQNRAKISAILVNELYANAKAFRTETSKSKINNYISLTLTHGTSFCSVPKEKEFSCLRDQEHVFNYAATRMPHDPRGFLRKLIATIEELQNDDKFHTLRYTSCLNKSKFGNVYRRPLTLSYPFFVAAFIHPGNPRRFLRDTIKKIEELKQDECYTPLLNNPHYFIAATIYRPNGYRKYLDNILENEETLYETTQDKEPDNTEEYAL